MNIGLRLARRYLFSAKSANAIHIISGISVVAFLVGSAALIIILSALNGFESIVSGMIGSFDPPLKVTPVEGKVFKPDVNKIKRIEEMKGVLAARSSLEENGVITYQDAQEIVKLKGVELDYPELLGLDTLVIAGNADLKRGTSPMALFGSGVASRLNVNVHGFSKVGIFIPDRNARYNPLNPAESLNMDNVLPAGIFVLQEDVEKDYVVVAMELMRNLLQYTNEVSAIEIFTDPKADQESLKQEIGDVLGDKFIVKDRREQNEAVFKIFKSEKLATYLILLFILIVASFNMIGALTMLVIEKKKDILVLKAMGFTYRQIRSVFLYEGLLLALIGGAVGLIIGVGVCLLQQEIGFIPLENSVVAYYPVKVIWQDVLLVWMTIVVLGLLSSFWPAYNSVKTDDVKLS